MGTITLQFRPDADGNDGIPHGHGLSFKRGIVAGLLAEPDTEPLPNGHDYSFERGKEMGEQLRAEVAKLVKE